MSRGPPPSSYPPGQGYASQQQQQQQNPYYPQGGYPSNPNAPRMMGNQYAAPPPPHLQHNQHNQHNQQHGRPLPMVPPAGAPAGSAYPQFAQHYQQYQQHLSTHSYPPAPGPAPPSGPPPAAAPPPMGMAVPSAAYYPGMPMGSHGLPLRGPQPPQTPPPSQPRPPPPNSSSLGGQFKPASRIDDNDDVEMEIEDSEIGGGRSSAATSRSQQPPAQSMSNGRPMPSKEISADELDARMLMEKREEKRRQKGQEQRQRELQEAEKRDRLFSIEDKRKLMSKKQDGFLGKLKYRNSLPDIPFDPKLLQYPFDPLRFVRYSQSMLEKKFKFDMRPEPNLGIHIDLIDISKYTPSQVDFELSELDNVLLERYTGPKAAGKNEKGQKARPIEPWLRRTEYTSGTIQRAQARDALDSGRAKEAKLLTADEQIDLISRSFDDVKKIPKHPQFPTLKVVEVLPLFPDFELSQNSYIQALFDSDPSTEPTEIHEIPKQELKRLQVESAILKPVVNPRDKDDNFVLFSIPKEESVLKRKRQEDLGLPDDEEDEYAFECIREYTCNIIKNDETKRNYFLVFRENQPIFYNECPSSLALHIRGIKRSRFDNDEDGYLRPSGMTLKRRELTEEERNEEEEDTRE